MAHVDIIIHHRAGNRIEEVGGEMVRGVGRGGWMVLGLVFPERGRREDED